MASPPLFERPRAAVWLGTLLIAAGVCAGVYFRQSGSWPQLARGLARDFQPAATPPSSTAAPAEAPSPGPLTYEQLLAMFRAEGAAPAAADFARAFRAQPELEAAWRQFHVHRDPRKLVAELQGTPAFGTLLARSSLQPAFRQLAEKMTREPSVAAVLRESQLAVRRQGAGQPQSSLSYVRGADARPQFASAMPAVFDSRPQETGPMGAPAAFGRAVGDAAASSLCARGDLACRRGPNGAGDGAVPRRRDDLGPTVGGDPCAGRQGLQLGARVEGPATNPCSGTVATGVCQSDMCVCGQIAIPRGAPLWAPGTVCEGGRLPPGGGGTGSGANGGTGSGANGGTGGGDPSRRPGGSGSGDPVNPNK